MGLFVKCVGHDPIPTPLSGDTRFDFAEHVFVPRPPDRIFLYIIDGKAMRHLGRHDFRADQGRHCFEDIFTGVKQDALDEEDLFDNKAIGPLVEMEVIAWMAK